MDMGLSADGCAQLIWIVCLSRVILWAIYILSLIYSYWAFMFHPHSVLLFSRSHPASLLPLCFFFPFPLLVHFHPSVTIATEERPSIEKGIRLTGAPSHLAQRGGWGGGRSSGSMFELKALCPSTRHRSHSHSWPLTPSASPSAPIGGAVRLHESAVPLTFDLQNRAVHGTSQCCVTVSLQGVVISVGWQHRYS